MVIPPLEFTMPLRTLDDGIKTNLLSQWVKFLYLHFFSGYVSRPTV
jgi:hypothetical protein